MVSSFRSLVSIGVIFPSIGVLFLFTGVLFSCSAVIFPSIGDAIPYHFTNLVKCTFYHGRVVSCRCQGSVVSLPKSCLSSRCQGRAPLSGTLIQVTESTVNMLGQPMTHLPLPSPPHNIVILMCSNSNSNSNSNNNNNNSNNNSKYLLAFSFALSLRSS